MQIEIEAPASLLLGLVQLETGVAALGLTVKYPPVQLVARPAPRLEVSGACAPVGYAAAERVCRVDGLPGAEIEIELGIPRMMGLASDEMLGLSTAHALALLNSRPAEAPALARALDFGPPHAPEVWGFDRGGLLLTDVRARLETPPLRRLALAHPDEAAWVIVLYLPRPGDDAPDSLEADRRAALLSAAPDLARDTVRLLEEELWPAAERGDFATFARALQALHDANLAALQAAGAPLPVTDQARRVLELMRSAGVPACGRCLTGLGVYGLIQGAGPSVALRKQMAALVGHEGGTVMATITDNTGGQARPT